MKSFVFRILNLFTVLVILFGCAKSKSLTPEEAKTVLDKNPGGVARSIPKILASSPGGEGTVNEEERVLVQKLEGAGYVSLRETTPGGGKGSKELAYQVTGTPKLLPFIISEDERKISVKVAAIVVNEIREITEQVDEAKVLYTTKLVPNELGVLFQIGANPSPGPHGVTFKKINGRWQ